MISNLQGRKWFCYVIERMRLVLVPVDPKTYKVDMKAMEKAINRKTCMVSSNWSSFIIKFYI